LKKLIVGLVAGAVLATTAVAVASIPSSDGVFTACVKSDGTLRLIDAEAGATCKANERTITWSEIGPAGPQGPPGPSGGTGYQIVTRTIEFPAPPTSPRPNPTVQYDEVVNCPAGKRATHGGVRSVVKADGTPDQAPDGEFISGPSADFTTNAGVGFFADGEPFENVPSAPTGDGGGWRLVGSFTHPKYGDSFFDETRGEDWDVFGGSMTLYAICVDA
jgi:hypothetical protein